MGGAKGHAGLAALILCLCASAAPAQEAQPVPFCVEGERFHPDGQIVEIGDRFFRICRGSFRPPPQTDAAFLKIDNHQAFLDAARDARFPGLRYGGVIDAQDFPLYGRPYGFRSVDVGVTEFGGLSYTVLMSEADAKRLAFPEEILTLRSVLFHAGNEVPGVPPHYLSCDTDPRATPTPDHFCSLSVRYPPSEYLYIRQYLMYAKGFPLGRDPFDFGRIGWQVRGMVFIAGQMDVTDRLGELAHVPIARPEH